MKTRLRWLRMEDETFPGGWGWTWSRRQRAQGRFSLAMDPGRAIPL